MARRNITFENNEHYHIYNRGVDKRDIVSDRYDISRFLESLEVFNTTDNVGSIYEYSRRRKKNKFRSRGPKLVEIIAFNILDNHYHLVLRQLLDGGISKFMQNLGAGFTKHFNLKYERSGALFQGPFKAKYIDSDDYLNYIVAYVNLNHLIHKYKKIKDPIQGWGSRSSLEQYILKKDRWRNKNFVCNTSIVLDKFNNKDLYLKDALGVASSIMAKRYNDFSEQDFME